MSIIPLNIPGKQNILLAGAGGGFDFLCGLPLVLELEAYGHTVHIANYSFTSLHDINNANWHSEYLLEINSSSHLSTGDYFPELYLSKWYSEVKNHSKPIWCFLPAGVQPTTESYNYIISKFNINTVFCIDGGIDGIFRGDEFDLGTPSMDSISVISTSLSSAQNKYYACTAFGTEGAEGKVSHAQALNRVADLIKMNSYIGSSSIHNNKQILDEFHNAVKFIYSKISSLRQSIIINSIIASAQGNYGKMDIHSKTSLNPPWISPLTSIYWFFHAEQVAKMKLFYDDILNSKTVEDVSKSINKIRDEKGIRPYEAIPI